MSCAPFCTMEKSQGRYKDNSALTFHLDRGILAKYQASGSTGQEEKYFFIFFLPMYCFR